MSQKCHLCGQTTGPLYYYFLLVLFFVGVGVVAVASVVGVIYLLFVCVNNCAHLSRKCCMRVLREKTKRQQQHPHIACAQNGRPLEFERFDRWQVGQSGNIRGASAS